MIGTITGRGIFGRRIEMKDFNLFLNEMYKGYVEYTETKNAYVGNLNFYQYVDLAIKRETMIGDKP